MRPHALGEEHGARAQGLVGVPILNQEEADDLMYRAKLSGDPDEGLKC